MKDAGFGGGSSVSLDRPRIRLGRHLSRTVFQKTKFEQFGMKYPEIDNWIDFHYAGKLCAEGIALADDMSVGTVHRKAWDIWRVSFNRLGLLQARSFVTGIVCALDDIDKQVLCGLEIENVDPMWFLMRHPLTKDINVKENVYTHYKAP